MTKSKEQDSKPRRVLRNRGGDKPAPAEVEPVKSHSKGGEHGSD